MPRKSKFRYKQYDYYYLCAVYYGMRRRCEVPENQAAKHYHDKGIRVCEEWKNSRDSFIEWALSTGYLKGLHLDRKDSKLGYSPSNCRWLTPSESGAHTDRESRKNTMREIGRRQWGKRVKLNGVTYGSIPEAAESLGLTKAMIYQAIRYKCRAGKKYFVEVV
jgi:hypothetical protein